MWVPANYPKVENGEEKGRSKPCGGDRVEQLEQEEEPGVMAWSVLCIAGVWCYFTNLRYVVFCCRMGPSVDTEMNLKWQVLDILIYFNGILIYASPATIVSCS